MNIRDKDDVHVIVVLDGRPGHEKQSLGIVQALEQRVVVNTTTVDVSKRGFFSQLLSYIKLLSGWKTLDTTGLPNQPDLVIGTGTRTHTTVLLLKRYFQIPAVTCMTPGVHLRNLFDICFVPQHDGVERRYNYFSTYGAPNTNTDKGIHSSHKGLILVGGEDDKSHVWESDKIIENILQVVDKEKDIDWVISSSPRTPKATVRHIKEKILQFSNCVFFDFKDTPKGWVEEQYDMCKSVWVTTDSISMLYEALSSGCSVHVFPMSWKKDTSKFKANENLLIAKRLVIPFSDWEKGITELADSGQLNEALRCADYILETCWTKN
ncbi:mitochondrial fission ELM1 family protein [Desulforhopalus sp. 52FAK]